MNEKLSFKNPWLYVDMAILYLAGSLAGVPFEGIWSVVTLGHWETHVVSMFGPFCIIYGLGGALFYAGAMALQKRHFPVKFAVFSAIGTLLELIIGLLLLRILNVRPWDYRRDFI